MFAFLPKIIVWWTYFLQTAWLPKNNINSSERFEIHT